MVAFGHKTQLGAFWQPIFFLQITGISAQELCQVMFLLADFADRISI